MNNFEKKLKKCIKNLKTIPEQEFLDDTYSKLNLVNNLAPKCETLTISSNRHNKIIILGGLILSIVLIISSIIYRHSIIERDELNDIDTISYGTHLVL
jgi:hypothetical protein